MRTTKLVLLTAFLSSCSTARYAPIHADRLNDGLDNIIKEGLLVENSFFAPKHIYSKMFKVVETDNANHGSYRGIKPIICSGGKPTFIPSQKLTFILPKPTPGSFLDASSAKLHDYIQLAREYLQKEFFANMSDPGLLGGTNPYLAYVKKVTIDEEPIDHLSNDSPVYPESYIPALKTDNINEIKTYYSKLNLPEFPADKNSISKSSYFFVILDRKTGDALLVPRKANIISTIWKLSPTRLYDDRYNSYTTVSEPWLSGFNMSNGQYGAQSTVYVPSTTQWEVDGNKLYPLRAVSSYDLAIMRAIFAIKHSDVNQDYLIRSQQERWEDYMAKNTTLKEAPGENGTIKFEVSLDLTEFCTDSSVAKLDLLTK